MLHVGAQAFEEHVVVILMGVVGDVVFLNAVHESHDVGHLGGGLFELFIGEFQLAQLREIFYHIKIHIVTYPFP